MSTVLVLTPVIIANWPVITAAVAGAAAGLGLVVKESVQEQQQGELVEVEQSVEIEVSNSEILAENMATGKEIVLTRGELEIRVGRDDRGRCTVCAKGKGHTKSELQQIAEQFSQKMTQCFVYNRVMSEVKGKNFQVVKEEIMDDDSVRVIVRRWMD